MALRTIARHAVFVSAVGLAAAGCLYLGSHDRYPAPTVTSADLTTRAPTLPVLVLRLAQVELSLGREKQSRVDRLVAEADEAARAIDVARIGYLETLAIRVERGQAGSSATGAAATRLLDAIDRSHPKLIAILVRLHAELSSEERGELVDATRRWAAHREHAWSRQPDLRWIEGFRAPTLSSETLASVAQSGIDDALDWTVALERQVEDARLDERARRDLANRLRTDSVRTR